MNNEKIIPAINWNKIEDMIDKMTWDKLTEQFWLDTRIPVGNDMDDWRTIGTVSQEVINKSFAGLTLLDTLQSETGVASLMPDAITPHEEAVYTNIQMMESVHAKSYSTIFSTFNTNNEIDDIFTWIKDNPYLQYKANVIEDIYLNGTPLQRKAASVLLESFLFYSGFYTPLRFAGEGKMTNSANIIKLIIRDESVHGTYIGYKFKKGFDKLNEDEQIELKNWVYDTAFDLYENEVEYTKDLYTEIGWTQDVINFVEYNLNKALINMGFPQLFQTTASDVDPVVINGLSTESSNHDFFSQVGDSYILGIVEDVDKDDFSMIENLIK